MEFVIKHGMPQQGESLCKTCQWCHMIRGYRESEEVQICSWVYPSRTIPFAVRDCSDYSSTITPSPKKMEEIALIISTEPSRKPAGFAGLGFSAEPDDEDAEAVRTEPYGSNHEGARK